MYKLLPVLLLSLLALCGCEQLQVHLDDFVTTESTSAGSEATQPKMVPERRQLGIYNDLDDVLVFQDGASGVPVYVRFAFVPYADSYPDGYWKHYPLAKSLLLDVAEKMSAENTVLSTSKIVSSIHKSFLSSMATRFASYQIESPFADLVIYRVSKSG
ncbi:hypothetical protein [Pelagibaculum spongiae]|uniref:Uncharacterized protein n=1 Tax=Pelagibaculum spongiae TaxID=2080658 RepID=A0A2V1GYF6_9GAMM|nr:hypothetical protein [Pelagibaculum spongiae]PVZ70367.1 hypothetical protein DC094_07170 [Pelagibaculum spongiae]